jgi:glycosyltransferase involved in cell wall biosynthesis
VIVAYLVNQYPRPSHSFIRREIHALEGHGLTVHRFTIRPFAEVVDEQDRAEQTRTRILLKPLQLALSTIATLLGHPARFLGALERTIRIGRRSERGVLVNLIYLTEACYLIRLLRKRKVEHLHAHFGTNSTTVALLARELGGPAYSFTCHGPEEFDRPEALCLDEKVARSSFAVAISSFGRSQLYRWTDPADWNRIHIVHCGLDGDFLDAPPEPIPLAPRLVCVGRLAPQKGQLLLLEAAGELARQGVAFELVLVGDGPLRPRIERQIEKLGLRGRVHITGWMSNAQVRQQIQSARALVLPSFAEGLPVVIMEALALHRPVISTYVAGIPELVVPGETGWLAAAGAIEPLVEAMREALTAPVDQLEQMGRKGAARVQRDHNAATEAAKLVTLFSAGQ